jgi:peptide/nickel transport system ATP-binding protein
MSQNILKIESLTKKYVSGIIRTVTTIGALDVSFDVEEGSVVSLVGESGSGKSTIANMILRFINPTKGNIFLNGKNIHKINKKKFYRMVQGIFQDPYSSFNSFYTIDHILKQAYSNACPNSSRSKRRQKFIEILNNVGLDPSETLGRYPHQVSGGQLQRILIARALLFEPKLLIADEPTSMIDSSSRAGILNLFKALKQEYNITIIFITHDIGQAQYLSDYVIVMQNGKIVEQGETDNVFLSPKECYTQNLLNCVPSLYRNWNLFNFK